jgi:tyrosyl-tRNA synthetase
MTKEETIQKILFNADRIIDCEALFGKKKLKIKWGCDPTNPNLHLGHYVILKKLALFQELGHEVQLLIGDFTALIGDPTDKSQTRPRITKKEVDHNGKNYLEQALLILDPHLTKCYYNSEWLSPITLEKIIEISSTISVQHLLNRRDFKNRLENNQPLHLHELFYSVLSGYDSYILDCDIEVGGKDQELNILVGRLIQRNFGQREQGIITFPLLRGLDGLNKMSKSQNNFIGLNEDYIYGKIMSISDQLMEEYYNILQISLPNYIPSYVNEKKFLKEHLSFTIISEIHHLERAQKEKELFHQHIKEKSNEVYTQSFKYILKFDKTLLRRMLVELGLLKSTSDVIKLIEQRGLQENGKIIENKDYLVSLGIFIYRIGKRQIVRVSIEQN